jgi:hypothetical protein
MVKSKIENFSPGMFPGILANPLLRFKLENNLEILFPSGGINPMIFENNLSLSQ